MRELSRSCQTAAALVAVTGLLVIVAPRATAQTQAAPIPPESAVKPEAVHGLKVAYYDFERVRPVGSPGIDSWEIAKSFIAQHQPDVTAEIKVAHIDFPAGVTQTVSARGTTLGAYLLSDPAAMENPPAELARKLSSRNIFVFTGFIQVDKAGTYTFRVPSDDACELAIGGVVIHTVETGGMYAATHASYLAQAEFSEPGIYPIKVIHWDKALNCGVEVYSDLEPHGEAREVAPGQDLYLLKVLTEKPAEAPAEQPAKP